MAISFISSTVLPSSSSSSSLFLLLQRFKTSKIIYHSMDTVNSLPWNKRPIVISGPSGSGKSTLLKILFAKHGDKLGFSVSHTTRKPRSGETDGKEYHFVNESQFKDMIEKNAFLEWAIYAQNYYGTSMTAIQKLIKEGKIPILDIDLAGVKSVKRLNDQVQARFVFIKTTDLLTLESRLKNRGTESDQSLANRLNIAREELDYASSPNAHDCIIVNENVDKAYQQLEHFIFSNKNE